MKCELCTTETQRNFILVVLVIFVIFAKQG